jgi:hypothetical protein
MEMSGLAPVPLFFVSPVADSSLAYSNVMAEWLSPAKQNRVYIPDEPFPHGQLTRFFLFLWEMPCPMDMPMLMLLFFQVRSSEELQEPPRRGV